MGDVLSLSVSTPEHLNKVGLLDEVSNDAGKIKIKHCHKKVISSAYTIIGLSEVFHAYS